MLKRIALFALIAFALFIVSYYIHFLSVKDKELSFSLISIYLFHFIASLLVYVSIEFIFILLPHQAGFVYLFLIPIKSGLFLLMFRNILFSGTRMMLNQRLALVIPMFVFLIFEVLALSKTLNSQQA